MGRIQEIQAERESEQSFNANDPAEVEARQRKFAKREAEKAQVLERLLSTAAGRRWIADIIIFCDPLGNPHVPNSFDATAFNAGMANVGKMLLGQILDIAPERYGHMLREARKEE